MKVNYPTKAERGVLRQQKRVQRLEEMKRRHYNASTRLARLERQISELKRLIDEE